MAGRIAVGDIMTRNFVRVSPETNLLICAKEMVRSRVNSLLITRGDKLLGIITARDILWAITKKQGLKLKEMISSEIATKKIAVIKPSADINQALSKMKNYGFRRLPVISKGRLVGMVTLKDILRIDPSLYSQIEHLAEIREESRKLEKAKFINKFPVEGLCEECGSFSEMLNVEGRMLCPDCRNELY